MRRPSKISEEQRATAFYSKGPYTAHNAITCAIVKGPDDFMQTTSTILGAHRLAELLNHAHRVVTDSGHNVVANTHFTASEIVAHAVAKSLGWRLEPPDLRKQRLRYEAEVVDSRSSEQAATALASGATS